MRTQRAKRVFVASTAGLLMAGGAALGTAGTASASAPVQEQSHSSHCDYWWDDYCHHDWRGGNGGYDDDYGDRDHYGDHGDHDYYDHYDHYDRH